MRVTLSGFAENLSSVVIYGGSVQMHKRHCSSMTVRPVWNVMVCCNNTPENLLVIPPINADMTDKVAILSVQPVALPADAHGEEGRVLLQQRIRAELPALAHHLEQREIPEEFRDPRGRGILVWRDPELMAAFDNTKPERQLAEILEISIQRAPHLWQDLPAELTAIEVKPASRIATHP